MKTKFNFSFGGVILEISIGLACLIPAYVVVVSIAEYMQAISSVREITSEAARRFDLRLLRKNAGIEATEVNVNQQLTIDNGTLSLYARNIGTEIERFNKLQGSTVSVNYMIKYVSVDPVTGEANRTDLHVESTTGFSSDPRVPRFAKGGSGSLHTQYLERALDKIQQNPLSPFPWAIPSGLRDVHQVSYLGGSPIYSRSTANQNDVRTANYLRYAPIVGISVVLDISNTRTGRFIQNLPNFLRIFSSDNSGGFNLRDNPTLIHETQLIVPRNPGI